MIRKTALIALLSMNALYASSDIKPVLQMGYDFGGKTLATVNHEYEGINKIRAGQGLNFDVGAVIDDPNGNLQLQFLVGYRFDREDASNGHVTWDVIPFTALAMFKSQRWKFGGGVTYHLNPSLEGSFSGYENGKYFKDSVDDEYESAFGGIAQIQYMATDSLAIGIKGTFIEYKLKSDPNYIAQGNSVGINFSYMFGHRRSIFR